MTLLLAQEVQIQYFLTLVDETFDDGGLRNTLHHYHSCNFLFTNKPRSWLIEIDFDHFLYKPDASNDDRIGGDSNGGYKLKVQLFVLLYT